MSRIDAPGDLPPCRRARAERIENEASRRSGRTPDHRARVAAHRRGGGGRQASAGGCGSKSAPRLPGIDARMGRHRWCPPRSQLRLLGQPLPADRPGSAVRSLPLRRRGAGAQALANGQDRRRWRDLRHRTAGPARSPALAACARPHPGRPRAGHRRRAPAPARDRQPGPRALRPRRPRGARAHRVVAASGRPPPARGKRLAGSAVRTHPRRPTAGSCPTRWHCPSASRALRVTCLWTHRCIVRSGIGWYCSRTPTPKRARCSGSLPDRPRGRSSSDSVSSPRERARSEHRRHPGAANRCPWSGVHATGTAPAGGVRVLPAPGAGVK